MQSPLSTISSSVSGAIGTGIDAVVGMANAGVCFAAKSLSRVTAPESRRPSGGVFVGRTQRPSQGTQEFEERFLILLAESIEPLALILCFSAVPQDGIAQGEGGAVMHEPRAQSHSP